MSTTRMKQGDLLPVLTATLQQRVGTAAATAIDLTTATTVKFSMRDKATGTVVLSLAAATIVNAATGAVSYSWQTGDTATAGIYEAEWQINFGALPLTVPNGDFDEIVILDDIA